MSTDLYVLAPDRTAEIIQRFRERWLDGFDEVADEYEYPQYADDPETIYERADDLVHALLAAPTEEHAIYWHARRPGPVTDAMLFFTPDGKVIAGLTAAEESPERARPLLTELAVSVGGTVGYVTSEEPPPETAKEFVRRAQSADVHL